ncbi:MAG: hypothetical protein NT178_17565 [Proteobacteria bacterium]|nr:hypothetical protein [Pseudomonadota bacterium]
MLIEMKSGRKTKFDCGEGSGVSVNGNYVKYFIRSNIYRQTVSKTKINTGIA